MEIWDLYDRNENLTGQEWERAKVESIPDGLFHLVCEILVRHVDDDFLIMQRDWSKKFYPGYWEATASGSALKGESPLICAKRELFEETGIESADFTEIVYSIEDDKHGIWHSYLTTVDWPKDKVTLQEGETISFKWISKDEFIEFMQTDQMGANQIARYSAYVESLKRVA